MPLSGVSLKADLTAALRQFDLTMDEAERGIVRALNKTARTAKAQAAREIVGAGYGIKVAAIKKAITIRRATSSELTAALTANGRPIPLVKYGARQTKAGVSVAVLHGRKIIKHAFIATMRSGHQGVFIRADARGATKATNAKGFTVTRKRSTNASAHHGLPIDELFGPAIPSAFANNIVQQALADAVRERFGVVLKQELNFVRISN